MMSLRVEELKHVPNSFAHSFIDTLTHYSTLNLVKLRGLRENRGDIQAKAALACYYFHGYWIRRGQRPLS